MHALDRSVRERVEAIGVTADLIEVVLSSDPMKLNGRDPQRAIDETAAETQRWAELQNCPTFIDGVRVIYRTRDCATLTTQKDFEVEAFRETTRDAHRDIEDLLYDSFAMTNQVIDVNIASRSGKKLRITPLIIEHYISDQILCYVDCLEHLFLFLDNCQIGRVPRSIRAGKYVAAQKMLSERLDNDARFGWIRLAGFLSGAAGHGFQADFHLAMGCAKQRLAPLVPILDRVIPQIFVDSDDPDRSFADPNLADWAQLCDAAESVSSSFSGFREKHRKELLSLMSAALIRPRDIVAYIAPRYLPQILQ